MGSVPLPADSSIAHRALFLGALSSGPAKVSLGAHGDDVDATLDAIRAFGIQIEAEPSSKGSREATLLLRGRGLYGLAAPPRPLASGASLEAFALLASILAAQPFASEMDLDPRLAPSDVEAVVAVLVRRGARITTATSVEETPGANPKEGPRGATTLRIAGLPDGDYLNALEHTVSPGRAFVKDAALISGLFAHGATYLTESAVTRDHTERLLESRAVPIQRVGSMIALDPAGWTGSLAPTPMRVPGDLSAAALVVAAAQIAPQSRVTLRDASLNPSRAGFLEVARDMGVAMAVEPHGEESGEPTGDVSAGAAPLAPARLGGELLLRSLPEIDVICGLAAFAKGRTVIRDLGEHAPKVAAIARVLEAFGVASTFTGGCFAIDGQGLGTVRAASLDVAGDGRLAMLATLLALGADGTSTIRDVAGIRRSFPRLVGTLRALGANVEVVAPA